MDAMEHAGLAEPIKGAVSAHMVATFEVPDSWSKAKREAADMHIIKPDLDNVVKAVFDGCNGVIWVDDCQVCEIRASKGYSGLLGDVGVQVTVEWL